jgi:murein DD-endopeptidase MepM/ murein hydrolase activator NlpD
MKHTNWTGFNAGVWQDEINVRDFIQTNYKAYEGDADFLASATPRTTALMKKLQNLFTLERQFGGVLDIDTTTVSSLASYSPGYLDKDNEIIVGLQTNRPLKRGVNPFGGMRMVRQACEAYGYKLSEKIEEEFRYRTSHNEGVFRAYTDEMRAARKCHVITGLPDAYGRGRIIGDYRRVALYGVDRLIEEKKKDKKILEQSNFRTPEIRLNAELTQQINLLERRLYAQSLSFEQLRDMAGKQEDKVRRIPAIMPVPMANYKISSGFGYRRDPVYGGTRFHSGIDFSGPTGTPIYATADGVVAAATWASGYGNKIDLDHGYNYMTRYAHLNKIDVRPGEQVKRGQKIGEMGSTGKSTGPHLHYEVRFKDEPQNPAYYYYLDVTPEQFNALIESAENAGHVMD